ncbi:MAG: thiamine phosphate synthase [Myxococcales bacterium]|nr:thiamine phosphate synthase [Myxococcales bacterium]
MIPTPPRGPEPPPGVDGPGFRLLAITPPVGAIEPGVVEAWAGANAVGLAVLLREPGTGPRALVDPRHRLAALRRACVEVGVPCLLSVDLAHLVELPAALGVPGVVGVQLRGDPDQAALEAARRVLGPGPRLGRSCHGVPPAVGERASYSVFGPVFAPRTASPTPGPGKLAVGVAALAAFAARERHVFALGGVTPRSAAACVRAGAFGLASIRSFFGPRGEVTDNVARLLESLTEPADHAAPPNRPR